MLNGKLAFNIFNILLKIYKVGTFFISYSLEASVEGIQFSQRVSVIEIKPLWGDQDIINVKNVRMDIFDCLAQIMSRSYLKKNKTQRIYALSRFIYYYDRFLL